MRSTPGKGSGNGCGDCEGKGIRRRTHRSHVRRKIRERTHKNTHKTFRDYLITPMVEYVPTLRRLRCRLALQTSTMVQGERDRTFFFLC